MKQSALIALALSLLTGSFAHSATWDLKSDTWVATDALGRTLPGYKECGPPRQGKYVGIFYFVWMGQHGVGGPFDITKILQADPSDPQWGPPGSFHHWGESELGYYLSDDPYVMRKHCAMLASAGVDTLILDVTNAFTYRDVYMRLFRVLTQIRREGGATPQICFITHTSAPTTVRSIYDDLYSKGLFSDLWFRWDGKPLILASTDGMDSDVRGFFTFRESWAWSDPGGWFGDGKDRWPWLDHYPQSPGYHEKGKPEEIPVCIAEHPVSTIGRSFHDGKEPDPAHQRPEQGIFFADQWKCALEVDPAFVFVTGWNEWVAQRFIGDEGMSFAGTTLGRAGTYFVDQYTQEFSRDAEPMKGGHTDNYYYQLVDNIRRFKGVRAPESPSPATTIKLDGSFADWVSVGPEYRDAVYDTVHRDHPGWGSAGQLTNKTGRNDIQRAKVARDSSYVYFYVETREPLTDPSKSPNWMLLFIDIDGRRSTGWEGYDYLIQPGATVGESSVMKRAGDRWVSVGKASYRYAGNRMELSIPRKALGLAAGTKLSLDFHWADNIARLGDIAEFFTSGDSAPDRRFNYRYDATRR